MSEAIFALIPVRSLSDGKTRLAPAFSEAERTALIQQMLAGVIAAALATPGLAEVAVISPEPAVLAFATNIDPGVVPVRQTPGQPGLNPAVEYGRDRALAVGATGLLILFGDLPLVTSGAIAGMLDQPAQVVLAPDRFNAGTNASLVRFGQGGERFPYQYGNASLSKHLLSAAAMGLPVATVTDPALSMDLDTIEDWDVMYRHLAAPARLQPLSPLPGEEPWLRARVGA